MSHRRRSWLPLLLGLCIGLSGCSGCASYRRCSVPAPVLIGALPGRLSQTGLFVDGRGDTLSPTVRPYEPAFALWSDGASKRRWIELPEGALIDSTDMDDWSFPVGTKLWKEFSMGGQRVETRFLVKVGPAASDWAGAAYVWDTYQLDATLAPEGVRNADGQGYEVPSAADCGGCHGGRKSHVLGFSAVQLGKPGLPLMLDDLVSEGRLTTAPVTRPSIPGDEVARDALGYLHANCGHCHNSARPPRGDGARCYDPQRRIDFWLPSAALGDAREMPAATTTVPRFVTPGEPDESRLIALVSRRGGLLYMPPLGSHRVDPDGVSQLRAWIEGLKRER